MSCRFLIRVAASIAAVASITSGTVTVYAGGCGCEAPSQTVYHVHQRCHHGHCHRYAPPTGMLVPAAPMMAAPMMAAPMMAAPVMAAPVMQAPMMMQAPVMQAPVMQAPVMQAPVMTMAAPTVSLAPTIQLAPQTCAGSQSALQFSLVQGGASAALTQDQVVRALTQAALENQAKASPSAALRALNGSSLEERVKVLEDRVDALKANTDELNASTLKIIEAVKSLQTKVNE